MVQVKPGTQSFFKIQSLLVKNLIDPIRLLESVSSRWSLPARVLEELSRDPECLEAYSTHVGVHHAFTLRTHTICVLDCYERHFAQRSGLNPSERSAFRLFLALHDIGKPRAILAGNKRWQHRFTVDMIRSRRQSWPVDDLEFGNWMALVDGDPVGAYLKHEVELSEAASAARSMMARSSLTPKAFWKTLLTYYQCDVSAYTRRGGIMNSLDGLFEWDAAGEILMDDLSGLLRFSESTEGSVRCLEMAIFGDGSA
jgi:hypothetical protein